MKQIDWKGPEDGLPPVGAECEFTYQEGDPFFKCTPRYHGKVASVIEIEGNEVWVSREDGKFRPTRLGKDNEVHELVQVMVDYYDWKDGFEQYERLASYIHDAGYRKQMSRFEAAEKLRNDTKMILVNSHIADILNVLGYKE